MNKVILMGRLTRDPEVRYTQTSNTLVASFSLAVNRRFARYQYALHSSMLCHNEVVLLS